MKSNSIIIILFFALLFSACGETKKTNSAKFCEVVYQGNDERYNKPIDTQQQYFNPILSGFYPDPSICRKGDDYFLVNSSFAYYPGVPIFHSRDLVNWQQIGHVLNRPSQLKLDGIRLSGGIYAPAIEYNPHNDTFYLITTCVDGIGNFLVKTKDPFAGEWSEPIALPSVGGIDPSLFFDEDGSAYIVNNDAPLGEPEYDGHRAIWLHRFDPETDTTVGEARMIVDGGVDKSTKPVWIEGPHLYKIDGHYLLTCAEGGTGTYHSQVVLSAKDLNSDFIPYTKNPILTQRDMPEDRAEKVTSLGHADIVQASDGKYYAVFLGCRPYKGDLYYTGRETFLLPVNWEDGFPIILEKGKALPTLVDKAELSPESNSLTGNFLWKDHFESEKLAHEWIFIRTPIGEWWHIKDKSLEIKALPKTIYDIDNPAYIGRRIQHQNFEFSVTMNFNPKSEMELAGIVCFQNEGHNFVLGKTLRNGQFVVVLTQAEAGIRTEIASISTDDKPLELRLKAENAQLSFYGNNEIVAKNINMDLLTTAKAGGFVGATVGLYTTGKN